MDKYIILEDILGLYKCKEHELQIMLNKYKKYNVKIIVNNKTKQYIKDEFMLDVAQIEYRG